jgi:hypothetical protein
LAIRKILSSSPAVRLQASVARRFSRSAVTMATHVAWLLPVRSGLAAASAKAVKGSACRRRAPSASPAAAQLLGPVLPHGFEDCVAGLVGGSVSVDERRLDQTFEMLECRGLISFRAHSSHGSERESAGEHGHCAQEPLFVVGKQVWIHAGRLQNRGCSPVAAGPELLDEDVARDCGPGLDREQREQDLLRARTASGSKTAPGRRLSSAR